LFRTKKSQNAENKEDQSKRGDDDNVGKTSNSDNDEVKKSIKSTTSRRPLRRSQRSRISTTMVGRRWQDDTKKAALIQLATNDDLKSIAGVVQLLSGRKGVGQVGAIYTWLQSSRGREPSSLLQLNDEAILRHWRAAVAIEENYGIAHVPRTALKLIKKYPLRQDDDDEDDTTNGDDDDESDG
jgi:hypothetical protein